MRTIALVLASLVCAGHGRRVQTAFNPAGLDSGRAVGSARASDSAQMMARRSRAKAFDPTDYPGVQAPTGFWDPFNLVEGGDQFTDDAKSKFLRRRAVELKHGRVAMLACLGYIVPYFSRFPGSIKLDGSLPFSEIPIGIKALYATPALGVAQIFLLCGALEFGPFKNDPENPGDFGWDPLNLKPDDPEEFRKKQNAELANGRLAMLASLGFIAGDVINDGNPYVGGPFTAEGLPDR
mmetsp:Transcript_166773/g.295366  ORF Transcript_166773/g.295366 Transcript_166773/m.295366 type:complete len:237 (-) Transcript_166773:131-841(-)